MAQGPFGRSRAPSFLPHPNPALLLEPFFARSLTLVPRYLFLHRTETFTTQAIPKGSIDMKSYLILGHYFGQEPIKLMGSCFGC